MPQIVIPAKAGIQMSSRENAMDVMNPAFEKAIAAKNARRKRLAKLPIHNRLEIVVQMQQLAAPLLKAQGRAAVVWKIGGKG